MADSSLDNSTFVEKLFYTFRLFFYPFLEGRAVVRAAFGDPLTHCSSPSVSMSACGH